MFPALSLEVWSFIVEVAILLADVLILAILVIEYYYDKKIYETRRKNYKRKKNEVIIDVVDGQAVIASKPKDVNVIVNTRS
jgi:hypothetical protein